MTPERYEMAKLLQDKLSDIDHALNCDNDWGTMYSAKGMADDIIAEAAAKIRQRLTEFRGNYQKQFEQL